MNSKLNGDEAMSKLNFVTAVLIVGALSQVACSQKKEKTTDANTVQTLVVEGNQKSAESVAIAQELRAKYAIHLEAFVRTEKTKVAVPGSQLAKDLNWLSLTRADRQIVKEKLAAYVTLVSRLIEIDAKKGVTVDEIKEIRGKRETALQLQRSLEFFEAIYGEQYEPKNPEFQPRYRTSGIEA